MKYYSSEIVIEKEMKHDGYLAYSPTVPGCFSNGRTMEEAKRNIRDVIAQHIDSLISHGEISPPQNNRVVLIED